MQLSIQPHTTNKWPVGGIVIGGSTPLHWLRVINQLGIATDTMELYVLPGAQPHSMAGCLVPLPAKVLPRLPAGAWQYYQVVSNNMFIAENAILFPLLATHEIDKLFAGHHHFAHPVYGWVVLPEPIAIASLFAPPHMDDTIIISPHIPATIPTTVTAFMIAPVAPEDTIEQLITSHPTQKLPEEPLNLLEKVRLTIYQLFSEPIQKASGGSGVLKNIAADYENLLERNQAVADRLLKMLRDNPAEALKYAIPLGNEGMAPRGVMSSSRFELSQIWSSFSLTQSSGSAGGVVSLGDRHFQLMQQYTETAQRLERQGAYQDAAFVYLKLLNKPTEAAAVLERGRHYAEAAAIYLQHAKDREKAALCYEKASMSEAAVALYKELQQYEKVGDMYASMGQKDMANTWYNEAANEQLRKAGYLQAALIFQHKIGNSELAQDILLRGWHEADKPTPCLQAYFTNITDEKLLMTSVNEVAEQLSNPARALQFIQVLITQYETRPQLAEPIADVAYAVVAQNVVKEPSLVASLRNFAPTDPELIKDAIRYKTMRGKK